jgi:predicted Rossmann fold flavoprotein
LSPPDATLAQEPEDRNRPEADVAPAQERRNWNRPEADVAPAQERRDWNRPEADVVVIGGGAAGFFAAIACAEAGKRVVILEKGRDVLAKVRISGGGRCNVTHACYDPKTLTSRYPRGGKALLGPFHKFQPRDTVKWFESRGVKLKTEPDGRVFPVSDRSQTVIDALTSAAAGAGVRVRAGAAIDAVSADANGFRVRLKSGEDVRAGKLLLATGSNAQGWQWARDLGHAVEPPVPSLFTLTVPGKRLEGLAGVSVENARLAVAGTKLRQTGALLITHWGLSGPAALKLSAWGARELCDRGYQATLEVAWTDAGRADAETALRAAKAAHPRKAVASQSPFPLPRRLWERLARLAGVPEDRRWADLTAAELRALAGETSEGRYEMKGKSAFKEEFVTCGGVRLDEVDFRTMESRLKQGLYFAGEVLDIDGVTGGFNFQSAWTTGWLAGRAMAGL